MSTSTELATGPASAPASAPLSAPPSEDHVRGVINRWSHAGYFRLKNMGDKIFIEGIKSGAAHKVRLQTHYERRAVHEATEPYHGGPVDDRGQPPEFWSVPVRRPGPFEEFREVLSIPHTERVQMCPRCAGQGRVTCQTCSGTGQVACPTCQGRAYVEQHLTESNRDAQGNMQQLTRVVQNPCRCGDGQVICSSCNGSRVVRCTTCAGSGRVKTRNQVEVRFENVKQGRVLDVTPAPDDWLGTLTGPVILERDAPRIERCENLPDDVATLVREYLDKSHAIKESESRILRQHLEVQQIPLWEVTYKYAGEEKALWLCGQEQEIYAPNAPWNRDRLYWVLGSVFGTIAAVVGAVILMIVLFAGR